MGYDAISNAHVCAFANVSSKKKRGNKLPKMKQNKLVCKRDHCCVSKVSDQDFETEINGTGGTHPPSVPNVSKGQRHLLRMTRDVDEVLPLHSNEVIAWMNRSINRKSNCANVGGEILRVNGRSSTSGSCSSSCSDDDGYKVCLNDWEAVADSLGADSVIEVSVLEHHTESESLGREAGSQCVYNTHQRQGNSRAWSPDDVFRPQSLPRISRQQNSQSQNSRRALSSSPPIFSWRSVAVPELQPSVCPICCEDFDVTDSNFLPCPCGFRLCLFCHKRILEVDGRCPGCRKHYVSANAGVDLSGPTGLRPTNHWSKTMSS